MNQKYHKNLDLSYSHIIAIAAPVLIANLAMPIQGAIDVAVVGHFPNSYHLAGLGIASQLWLLILVSFNFLQYASSGLSAQALGRQKELRGDRTELDNILYRSLGLAVLLSTLLWLFKPFIISTGLSLLGAQTSSSQSANTYLTIRYYGIVFELMNYAFIGWFAGQGKTKLMMMVQILISVFNIILTLTFVHIFDLGIEGVALGTVMGYAIGCITAIYLARHSIVSHMTLSSISVNNTKRFQLVKARIKDVFELRQMLNLFSLNKDIFIRTLLLTLSFAWITRLSAQQGDLIMSANAVLLQVLSISAFALDGVAVAAESLSGQAAAQKNRQQFLNVVKRTGIITFWLASSLTIVWIFALPSFLNLMTDLTPVYNLAFDYRYIAAFLPLIGAGAYWLDGIMFGLTAGKRIRQVAVIVALIFFPLTGLIYEVYGSTYAMPTIWFSIYFLLLARFATASFILWRHQEVLIHD